MLMPYFGFFIFFNMQGVNIAWSDKPLQSLFLQLFFITHFLFEFCVSVTMRKNKLILLTLFLTLKCSLAKNPVETFFWRIERKFYPKFILGHARKSIDLDDSIYLGFQGLLTGFRRSIQTKDP